jgi:tRNA 2-selenouridine synthase
MEVSTLIDIAVEHFLNLQNAVPVDVRSPQEFNEGTIPGAVNVPLFDDAVRSEIGTIYKLEGQEQAKWRAMELVSPKLPDILSQIKDLQKAGRIPVVFCWRGGMRSKSVATFLEFSGVPAYRLEGGYRAYRQYILEKIPELIPEKSVVLHGMTGVGKTDILIKLEEHGYPVLDLEAMAAHKGSIFGAIGENTEGNNQKTFDALLFTRLREIMDSPYFLVEAESKRIGRVTQPEELLIKKQGGIHFFLYSSIANRVERIYQDYVAPFYQEDWFHPQVKEKFALIQKRIKNLEIKNAIIEALEAENYRLFILLLLEHYYDPRYEHKQSEYEGDFIEINTDDEDEAVNKIAEQLERLFSNSIRVKQINL